MNKFTRGLFVLMMAALVAGCGFQLRGSTPETRLAFESLYLDAPVGTPLERDLRTIIRAGNTQLAGDAKSAPVTLRVLSQLQ
nr:hypothetical protein [Oxalobacteraceae bacterium]